MAKIKKFGTFGGVFTPSILTILGVIMYMRLPMIAGEAGLIGTLGIIFIAHLISITTGLSVSSIATDKKVKEGGTYYIISRSLGLPIGGTLGLALFVGLSFSVSLYLIGFAESFLGYWGMPMDINHIRIAGSIILAVVTIITLISTSLAIKAQYLIMTAIFLSLLSILFGSHEYAPTTPNFFGSGTGVSLIVLFGIFFPAVTGFEAGVSMSGDLKDPKKSIPGGTITAIAIGLVVYIGLAFFFAYTVDGGLLATDPQVLFKISLIPQLVIAGIWGATLSSALGSILAAPRILQSTALDKITPRLFAKGSGASKEPRNALILTFLIAEAGILIGDLDVIARIVSVFFITTYGFLNLSAAFESLTSADFRPTFRTPAWISIIGAFACGLVMIQLDFTAMIGAIVILGALFFFLKRRQLVLETGDAWSSVWASLIRAGIRRLNKSTTHSRNWRPNIIVFSGQDKARPYLVEFAKTFCGKLGIFSSFEMVETQTQKLIKDERYFSSSEKKENLIIHQHKCRNIYEGMDEIARVYGFEGVEPNTILMGWSKQEKNKEKFLNLIKNLAASNFNTTYFIHNPKKDLGEKRTIDVWWSGWGSNLTFTIFLLRHFTASIDWKDAKIRLLIINNSKFSAENLHKSLQKILTQYRINMEITIINNSIDGLSNQEIIGKESAETDLTFIGIPDKKFQQIEDIFEDVALLSKSLGSFFLVNSSSKFDSYDLGIESKQEIEKQSILNEEQLLPKIQSSKYQAINDDIDKIDINGNKVISLFVEKALSPIFSEIENVNAEIHSAEASVFSQLNKLKGINDTYRRTKNLIKIKNDFYFKINRIFTELTGQRLEILKGEFESGISWYVNRLNEDLSKFPNKLKIPYEREDLKLLKTDPFQIKLFKLGLRASHPFSGKTIQGKIYFHKIAEYYLLNNRNLLLASFLTKLQEEISVRLLENRSIIIAIDNLLENLKNKSKNKEDSSIIIKNEQIIIKDKVEELKVGLQIMQKQTLFRLLLEFRKNLQLMSDDMGKADINYRIRKKSRDRKFYNELVQRNISFAEYWFDSTLLQLNKIHMEVLLQSFKSRVNDKINELNLHIVQQLNNRYKAELNSIRSTLTKLKSNIDALSDLKISINSFEENFTLLMDFDKLGDEILKLADALPENIMIANNKAESAEGNNETEQLNVPLRKITRFYINSRFLGPAHDELEKTSQSLKSSVFIIQDLLSLTRFNLENIGEDQTDKPQQIVAIITDAQQKIVKEEEKIQVIIENTSQLFKTLLEEVFNQLSTYKIPSAVAEYSRFIREAQGKMVLKTFDTLFERLKSFTNKSTARLLYSKSEGILLAKKMIESEKMSSDNQKILDLVESVTPQNKVIENLPQFYKNLFSGRSNISEDFWVKREKDELFFRTAVARFNSGFLGGIMVIGERNSGKSAFCRNIASKLFKKDKVLHIFSNPNGSSQISDFVFELEKVTGIRGSVEEIMDSLPRGTVFIIHDVELWWERSPEGWDVVRLIVKLINAYSDKFLFVANMNQYAFGLMNKMLNLQNEFISIISLRPFDSEELQEMIIRRHRSSGLKFILNKHQEDDLSEIRMASLFSKYFDYSEGNPGTALAAWMGNITKVTKENIYIKQPQLPDTRVLAEMEEDWKIILVQLILHKWLSFDRLKLVFHSNDSQTQYIVSSLLRVGLILEVNEGIFLVNNYVRQHIINVFKKEGLL